MSITDLTVSRQRNTITAIAVSDLSGTIYYHWYLDGMWKSVTQSGQYVFSLGIEEQGRLDCLDTNDPDFDIAANAPVAYPARRTLSWTAVMQDDLKHYRVEQRKDSGDWTSIAVVNRSHGQWQYSLLTPRLVDLSTYDWRIIPVDTAGNDGNAYAVGTEVIVRTPDAPAFSILFNAGPSTVTIDEG